MKMLAMQLKAPKKELVLVELPIPKPSVNEVLIKVSTCGVCRTDLHIIDDELKNVSYPIVPGHQIIGKIIEMGANVRKFKLGQRVGVPWLGNACGSCPYCKEEHENLCDAALYTGCNINGGFAEYCVANANYCFAIPDNYSDIEAAPLLCAGLIGYRSFRKLPPQAKRIGIYGFGSAAHIITQIANYLGKEIYAYTKENDLKSQDLALQLGAVWTGGIDQNPEHLLDGVIIYAPAGELLPLALKTVKKGGMVVCAGIHMTDIPGFPYEILWGERIVCSVANLTVQDGIMFMNLITNLSLHIKTQVYTLQETNKALDDLRHGRYTGSNVIQI